MALQLTCRPAKRSGPCAHCGKGESSQWRVGPPNAPTLCNAWCVPDSATAGQWGYAAVGAGGWCDDAGCCGGGTLVFASCPRRQWTHLRSACKPSLTSDSLARVVHFSGVCWGRKKKLPQVAGRSPSVSSAAELDRAVAPPVPASAPPRPRLGGQAAASATVNELAAVLLALGGGEAENCHGEVRSVAPPCYVAPQRRRSSTARSDRCVAPALVAPLRLGAESCLAPGAWIPRARVQIGRCNANRHRVRPPCCAPNRLLHADTQPRSAGRPVEESPGQASKRQRADADGAVPAAVPHWVLASAQLAHAPPTPMLGCNATAAPGGGVEAPVAPLTVTPLYAPPMWHFPPAFPPASMPAAGLFVPPSIKAV